ncbi:MAG: DUF2934 domain-containing protein [Candidatus Korobacteraceae bacterium]
MANKVTGPSTAKTEQGSLELREELIRVGAYHLYEKRGCEHGHDVDDWLQAEAEIFGENPAATAESETTEGTGKAAAA